MAERMLDRANGAIGLPSYAYWRLGVTVLKKLQRRIAGECEMEGGWSGNDAVWRTVLDINRIAMYGKTDGSMSETPQRKILNLTDALICAQGEGPLSPLPYPHGCVTYTDNSVDADLLHCALFGYDYKQITMLREACSSYRWRLTKGGFKPTHADIVCSCFLPESKPDPPTGWSSVMT